MARTSKTRPPNTSTDPATQYARDVAAGKVAAGPHVRAACARHLRDLEEGPARGLVWDEAAAARYYGFCRDVLRLNGGEFEGVPFELLDWQKFIGGCLFGWKTTEGFRRFRVAYIETAKGSGKSPFAASIGLYGLVADGEPRAEVYAAATKKDQAQILFRDAVAMVDQSPRLSQAITRSGGRGKEWNLAYLKTGSFFRPISSDSAQSGPRPHVALLDEVHEHKTGLMVEMMRAGTKGRRQALILMITNSGTDRQSVCWAYHEYAAKVAAATLADDSFFGYVAALDDADDPFVDEACWDKANPSLGITIPRKYLEEQVREARGMPSKESTVRRLNFCQWVEAANPWISSDIWLRAADADFDPDRLAGRRCYGGLDLSSTQDLTALVLLFEPTDDDPHWRQRSWFWIPDEAIAEREKRDRVPYLAWRAMGALTATPGAAIDRRFVLAQVVSACAAYDVAAIAYDRWRIEDFMQMVETEGATLPLQPFGQGFKDMSPAVDEYERLLVGRALRHDGNPVMTWNAASAVVDRDHAGNRKPSKIKSTGRIDGLVSAVMASGAARMARDESLDAFLAAPLSV